jgi:hypothetical protein
MSDTKLPDHETLERAFKPAAEAISRLPECVEATEARRLVVEAEKVAHVAREKHVRED